MSPFKLAWTNLTHQRFRTLISLIGVGFAVLLVFMQLGFREAVGKTATLLYDELAFDFLMVSSEYGYLAGAGSFSRDRIAQARSVPGVHTVLPVTTTLGLWRDPVARTPAEAGTQAPRRQWSILVLAIVPEKADEVFRRPTEKMFPSREKMHELTGQLSRAGTVLMDRSSRAEYGDRNTWDPSAHNELNGKPVEVAGLFHIGTGFGYNGLLMASEETVARAGWPSNRVSFGLIRLSDGADRERVRRQLSAALPDDVKLKSRAEINLEERTYWLTSTPVGQFFTAGVLIALLVGGIFLYQMMASDISKNLPEYATILALGYPSRFLSRVVYYQGMLLGLVGFIPGLIASLGCYEFISRKASLPISMTADRIVIVLVATLLMCMVSAAAAVRVVHRANPADLF